MKLLEPENSEPVSLVVNPSAAHRLNVKKNCLDGLLADFLHTTHCSRPEEDLGVAKPPLVVHLLDRLQNCLCSCFQVGATLMNLLWLDDDEPVNKVRIDGPDKKLLLINDIFVMTVL